MCTRVSGVRKYLLLTQSLVETALACGGVSWGVYWLKLDSAVSRASDGKPHRVSTLTPLARNISLDTPEPDSDSCYNTQHMSDEK